MPCLSGCTGGSASALVRLTLPLRANVVNAPLPNWALKPNISAGVPAFPGRPHGHTRQCSRRKGGKGQPGTEAAFTELGRVSGSRCCCRSVLLVAARGFCWNGNGTRPKAVEQGLWTCSEPGRPSIHEPSHGPDGGNPAAAYCRNDHEWMMEPIHRSTTHNAPIGSHCSRACLCMPQRTATVVPGNSTVVRVSL